jgi:DNA-binding response OmpR family regulator
MRQHQSVCRLLTSRIKVLVVDYEPIVLGVVTAALARSGLEAVTAQTSSEARLLFDAYALTLCLALIDIGPQMSGLDLVRSLPTLTPLFPFSSSPV